MAQMAHDREIVADEQHRGADVALQIEQQIDDLALDGHVQGTDRLIADQEFRAAVSWRGQCRCAGIGRR